MTGARLGVPEVGGVERRRWALHIGGQGPDDRLGVLMRHMVLNSSLGPIPRDKKEMYVRNAARRTRRSRKSERPWMIIGRLSEVRGTKPCKLIPLFSLSPSYNRRARRNFFSTGTKKEAASLGLRPLGTRATGMPISVETRRIAAA